jgi:hypothetical protein
MSITLIVLIALVVLSIVVKVRRGSFFRWGSEKETPNACTDDRADHDFR